MILPVSDTTKVAFLEFGDFGIEELFLLKKKWQVKRRHEKACTP